MKQNLTVEKNDHRLCMAGTENLWSVCNRQECGNVMVIDIVAENVGHADALLFAAAPDLLAALENLLSDKYLADPINADRMAKARAAIAKATGKGDA